MKTLWRLFACAAPAAALVLSLTTARADTLTGEVRGAVLDVDGGVPLATADLTLVNVDRGWRKQLKSDAQGSFAFIQLEPGNYAVTAQLEGYYPQEKTGILIRLNQPKVVLPPFMLRKEVPTPTQQLVVQGEGGLTRTAVVDLTSSGPDPIVLAYLSEPGFTSLAALLDWAIRANYDSSLLEALPLRGVRTFDQLALLSPGVARVPFAGGEGPAVGIGVGTAGQFSVNGQRGRSNNFTVDGSDNNDEDIGVRRQGFISLVPQSNESVQEFQITTAGFPAEFGRNSGSMVNAVSRSGTDSIHGAVYGIFDDDALNSRDFFDRNFRDVVNEGDLNGGSFTGSEFSRQLVGGVLGGPIVPDKLFYFGSIERQRQRGVALGHFVVPSPQERGLRTADPNNRFVPIEQLGDFFQRRGFRYSSLAGEAVYSLYPLPNNPTGPFGVNTYSQVRPEEGNGLVFSGKTDWYLSSVHSFAARYNFTDDDSIIPFTGEAVNSTLATETRTQNVSLFLNSTGPRIGNALRVSYGRTALGFPLEGSSPLLFGSAPLNPVPAALEGVESLGRVVETPYGRFGPFGVTGPIGQLKIDPFSAIGIDVFNFPQGRVDNTYQFSDFVTLNRSSHTLKFGFDIRRSQLNSFSDRNSRPLLQFNHGQSFCAETNPACLFALPGRLLRGTDLAALGAPGSFLHTISTQDFPNSGLGLRFTQYDFFVQDDWKIGERLSLNLGVRYELHTVPVDERGRIEGTFRLRPDDFQGLPDRNENAIFTGAYQGLLDFLGGRDRIYRRDHNNWAPRIGLAWDPLGKGNLVIRAGYGIAYDTILGAVTSQSRNVFPRFVPINFSPNSIVLGGALPGQLLPNTTFLNLPDAGGFLVRPGTLNVYNSSQGTFATRIGAILGAENVLGRGPDGIGFIDVNGLAFTLPEANPETPYAQHFLASVQKQFGRDFLASVEYVGARGRHLTRFSTPNGGLSTTPFFSFSLNPLVLPILDLIQRRPNPNLGSFRVFQNRASSDYNSLQVNIVKRFSRGYQFGASWTWSHAIDEVSDPFDGRGFFALPQNGARLDLERASANFDTRHRVSFHLVWELPGASVSRALANWQLAAIGEFQTGQPYTVNTAIDRNLDGNLTDRLDSMQGLLLDPNSSHSIRLGGSVSTLDLIAPGLQDGRVGRNTFEADDIATLDLALSKTLELSPETRLRLRVEVFNLFNDTQFGIPVRILESPGFGRSYDSQVEARSIRFGAKLSF